MLRVALTFDVEHPDRPTRDGVTQDIVAALSAADVRAIMRENPRRLVQTAA